MKVMFLDFNGVLDTYYNMDEINIDNLKRLKNSYFYTGRFTKHLEEIEDYLSTNNEIENFCIIDDDYDMEKFKDYLVKLPSQMKEGQMGLDDEHMLMAIKILNNNKKKSLKK